MRSRIAARPESPWGGERNQLVIVRAQGAEIELSDGRTYLDLVNGKGCVILGHNHPAVAKKVTAWIASQQSCGTGWGNQLPRLADEIVEDTAIADGQLAFFSTGTEACRAAVTLARRATGRALVLSAGYHGWDPMWRSGSGLLEPGPDGVIDFFFVPELLERALAQHRERVALVMFSPDYVYLQPQTLARIVDLARQAGVLVCCDDVKQGYRHAPASHLPAYAQRAADLYTFSKGLSNGARLSCLAGAAPLMASARSFTYTSYFDETPVVAARATLAVMKKRDLYARLAASGERLVERLNAILSGLPITVCGRGSVFQFVCATDVVEQAFHRACFAAGVLVFEGDNQMLSAAYGNDVVAELLRRFERVAAALESHRAACDISPQRRFDTAWTMIDGAPDFLALEDAVAGIRRQMGWS